MDNPSNYSISLSTIDKYVPLGVISVILICSIFFLSDVISDGTSFSLFFVIVWFGYWIYFGTKFIGMPSEIRITNGELATFIDIFGKEEEISLSEIQEIKRYNPMLKIKLLNKRIIGISLFDGFSRFVEDVRKNNPNLLTIRC